MYRLTCILVLAAASTVPAADQPDIILMMADDLGFSDIGCYGGEIPTPNIDRLASEGVLFTNFSNTSRCCPSRASLLTGMYSHRAGIGAMNYKDAGPGYRGQLQSGAKTLPEYLRPLGYSTVMVGKWHLTRSKAIKQAPNGSWPWQRGFDRFFGTMEGAKNYFRPTWLYDKQSEVKEFDESFFYTNAMSGRVARWIDQQPIDKPLFAYVAFYAPHFPLQAPDETIAKYRGRYKIGWDKLRQQRFERQLQLGVVPPHTKLSPRANDVPAWSSLTAQQRDELDLRMATYAAQVELLDRGVGRIIDALKKANRLDNTLVVFLSDNGAASPGGTFGAGPIATVGKPNAPVKTTYGKGWATLSNTPYRFHKANTHEGGVMAPLIMRLPKRAAVQAVRRDTAHIIDLAPTCIAAAGGRAPRTIDGTDLLTKQRSDSDPVFYEHENSRAMRLGTWKLVNKGKSREWELYNLATDRTEMKNLATSNPKQLRSMTRQWEAYAQRYHVRVK